MTMLWTPRKKVSIIESRLFGLLCLSLLGCVNVLLIQNVKAVETETQGKAGLPYEVLEPQSWIGKELPILNKIDIDEDLSRGKWFVIFYRGDSPQYQMLLSQYIDSARRLRGIPDVYRLAFIDVLGKSDLPQLITPEEYYSIGALKQVKQWLGVTPFTIKVDSGVVQEVRNKYDEKLVAPSESPLMVVLTDCIEYGQIAYGMYGEETVDVVNISESPLFIRTGSPCGCTTSALSYQWVFPGEAVEVLVRFSPKENKASHQEIKLSIVGTNHFKKQEQTILIKAEIVTDHEDESLAALESKEG